MDLGLLIRLRASKHNVAPPEPFRSRIRVLRRLRKGDAIFARIHADRSARSQAEPTELSLPGNRASDHGRRFAVANPKLRRSSSCTSPNRLAIDPLLSECHTSPLAHGSSFC